MGSGKTHIAKNYIHRNPNTISILSITFRVSLARYLASEFGISCYLEENIWNDDNRQRRERIVICLDSFYKLDIDQYDIIIIYEATFVQYHLLLGTIRPSDISTTLTKLKLYLKNTNKIIFMQHRIPDSTINFYCNLISCDPFDKNIVTKQKFDKPTALQALKKWAKIGSMISFMIQGYRSSFNITDGKSNNPFIVFCSRVDFSLALLQIMREVAQVEFGDEATMRVKGVWAQIQNDPWWCSKILTNPNSTAIDCDVLMVTNVLQAGHNSYFCTGN
ncbi:hypothetical protein [Parasitella parasitica]|uniref:Replication origin-binding protein domain-containing protein n=1 Tax=Parasitella parasitica TaxID=35722 RepID=A0A0B7MWK2_9FUNG|nr:hypothetical protein [Parasitella parasitica]